MKTQVVSNQSLLMSQLQKILINISQYGMELVSLHQILDFQDFIIQESSMKKEDLLLQDITQFLQICDYSNSDYKLIYLNNILFILTISINLKFTKFKNY